MGTGTFIIYCICYAIGTLLIAFPIAVFFVRHRGDPALPWRRGLALFGVTAIVVGVVNVVAFSIKPALLNGGVGPGMGLLYNLGVPIFVSCIILAIFWRPGEPKAQKAAPSSNSGVTKRFRLNTKSKRVWFLVFVGGLVLCGVTYLIFNSQYRYLGFDDALFNRPGRFSSYKFATLFGALVAICGLVMSFLHDWCVAPVKRWVNGISRDTP